jgi:hypothetical protein
VHLVNAKLDEVETVIGLDDGDRIAMVVRAGYWAVIVSAVKVVEDGEVWFDWSEVHVPDGEAFGWAMVGEDPDPVVMATSYRDGFVLDRMSTYVVVCGP